MPKILALVPSLTVTTEWGLKKNLEFQRVLHDLPGPSHEFDLKAPFTRQKSSDTVRIEVVRVPKKQYSLLNYTSVFVPC